MKGQSIIIALLAIAISPLGSLAAPNRIVEGEVELRREGWSRFRRVTIGTVVNYGDVIRLVDEEKAYISCAGTRPSRIPGGGVYPLSYFCGNPSRAIGLRSSREGISGGDNPEIPYLISPRRTSVRGDSVTFSWNSSPNATRYVVRLRGEYDDEILWEKTVTETEVTYDGEILLEPGDTYTVTIEADNQTSSESDQGSPLSSFRLLEIFERLQLEANRQELEKQELTGDAYQLALADIYIDAELFSEAITILESLVTQDTQIAIVYQQLGELYDYIGLNLQAKERYEQAIALAIVNQDLEVQTLAEVGLGKVMVQLDAPDTAIRLFTQARVGYQILGHSQQVENLQRLIQSVQS